MKTIWELVYRNVLKDILWTKQLCIVKSVRDAIIVLKVIAINVVLDFLWKKEGAMKIAL
jgi:hypothetical protein